MNLTLKKPDTFGAIASTLCMLHCLATPLLYVLHSSAEHAHDAAPIWWKSLDFIFLSISFFAVYRSTKASTKNFIKIALWTNWTMLFFIIMNEKLRQFDIPEAAIYIPAIILIVLHMYSLNYCQCKTENCCNKNG